MGYLKDQFGPSIDPDRVVEIVQHLLEPGETVRGSAIGMVNKGILGMARAAVIVTDAHIYVIHLATMRLRAKEVLVKYPLSGSRVIRSGMKLHVNDSSLHVGVLQFGQADALVELVHGL